MKRHFRLIGLLTICAVLLIPLGAMADDISPSTWTIYSVPGKLTVATIHKTVTISAGAPTAANADIYLLSDTTGSMGPFISDAKAGASDIVTKTTGIGGGTTQWAVGNYKDFPTSPWGGSTDYPYQLNTGLTTDSGTVGTAINAWSAGGGADTPEANLFAIQQAATTTAWRPGSARFIVQFGDAPGHEPANTPGYPGPTLAQATAALTTNNIKLIAVNLGDKDAYGQETAMTTATGGALYNGYSGSIADFIASAIETSFLTYHKVELAIAGLPPGIEPFFQALPASYTGDFTREEERKFDFDVTLVGCCAEFKTSFDFEIDALVDGIVVAVEKDRFNCAPIPVPPSLILLGSGLVGLIGFRRFKLN